MKCHHSDVLSSWMKVEWKGDGENWSEEAQLAAVCHIQHQPGYSEVRFTWRCRKNDPVSTIALFDTALFKQMNILFEWIFWILKKWILVLNEYSGFL